MSGTHTKCLFPMISSTFPEHGLKHNSTPFNTVVIITLSFSYLTLQSNTLSMSSKFSLTVSILALLALTESSMSLGLPEPTALSLILSLTITLSQLLSLGLPYFHKCWCAICYPESIYSGIFVYYPVSALAHISGVSNISTMAHYPFLTFYFLKIAQPLHNLSSLISLIFSCLLVICLPLSG